MSMISLTLQRAFVQTGTEAQLESEDKTTNKSGLVVQTKSKVHSSRLHVARVSPRCAKLHHVNAQDKPPHSQRDCAPIAHCCT